MFKINKFIATAAMVATLGAAFIQPSQAQVADTRLGVCPERSILTAGQLMLAVAIASTNSAERVPAVHGYNDFAIKECASTLVYHQCTSELLLGALDPVGAACGGIAGAAATKALGGGAFASLIGGAIGSGAVGLAVGSEVARDCRDSIAELAPTARAVFGRATFTAEAVTPRDILSLILTAQQRGVVSHADGQRLLNYVQRTSDAVATGHRQEPSFLSRCTMGIFE